MLCIKFHCINIYENIPRSWTKRQKLWCIRISLCTIHKQITTIGSCNNPEVGSSAHTFTILTDPLLAQRYLCSPPCKFVALCSPLNSQTLSDVLTARTCSPLRRAHPFSPLRRGFTGGVISLLARTPTWFHTAFWRGNHVYDLGFDSNFWFPIS